MDNPTTTQEPTINIVDTSTNKVVTATPETTTPAAVTQPVTPVAAEAPVVAEAATTTPEAKVETPVEDWKKISGDRFKTPEEMAKAYKEAQKLIASTRAIPELKKDATPEEVAKYRETYSIPKDAKSYNLEMEVPESHKASVDAYLEIAHKGNRSESVVKAAISDYLQVEQALSQKLNQQILDTQKASESQLKESWGPRYEDNKKIVENFFIQTFGDDSQSVLDAYLPDGTRMGDNAKIASKLLEISKNTLGATTIIPNGMINNSLKDAQARYNELSKLSQNSKSEYWGPNHAAFKQEIESLAAQIKGR